MLSGYDSYRVARKLLEVNLLCADHMLDAASFLLRGQGACQAALAGVVQESGAKDESSRFGTLTFNMTHASERGAAARKSQRVTRIARVEKFVGSRFTPTCNKSQARDWQRAKRSPAGVRHRDIWAKILGEEPLFSCMGLSFEERFGNVAPRPCGRVGTTSGGD